MSQTVAIHSIEAILFDANGTLRLREAHHETQQAAFARLRHLLGLQDVPEAYWDELTRRQAAYTRWAQQHTTQLSEAEIWAEWILPEAAREQIDPVAAELMLAWAERKGRVVPQAGASETIRALKERGYRLGIISNTMSTLDIPRSLAAFGWQEYFDVVVLSATLKRRKPAPEPFWEAARALNLQPACCAYLGNRISKDIVGCRRAGFALGIILEPPGGPRPDEQGLAAAPDIVIRSLSELLDIFPPHLQAH